MKSFVIATMNQSELSKRLAYHMTRIYDKYEINGADEFRLCNEQLNNLSEFIQQWNDPETKKLQNEIKTILEEMAKLSAPELIIYCDY